MGKGKQIRTHEQLSRQITTRTLYQNGQSTSMIVSENHEPSAFLEQIILPFDVYHAVLEDAFPFVLNTGNLRRLSHLLVRITLYLSAPCHMYKRRYFHLQPTDQLHLHPPRRYHQGHC